MLRNTKLALAMVITIFSATATEWPNNSVYQTESHWQTQNDVNKSFADGASDLRFVAFVYTHCISMCPVIVADLKRIEQKLPDHLRKKSQFTLVSLDPANDKPAVMAAFLKEHDLARDNWEFLRANDQDTRELALLMNIRYRQEGNEIAHSNVISLLDGNGILVHQRQGTGGLDELIAAASAVVKK